MPDDRQQTPARTGTGISHKIAVAAGVAGILGLFVATASFVYDRLDNREADGSPPTTAPTATSTTLPALPPAPTSPASSPTPSAPADPFVKVHDIARWTIPAPRSSCGFTMADLDGDAPRARVNTDDQNGDELLYWHCSPVGLQLRNGQAMGRAEKDVPATGSACEARAQQDAVASNLEPDELDPRRTAFCVVTDEGNVAWLNLLAKEKTSNPDPNLVFRLVVWHRR